MGRADDTILQETRVTVRMADDGDAGAIARLAALDSAGFPPGPTLVAEVDGEPAAALPVAGGPAVADPFRRTAAAIEMLELRAAQLRRSHEPPASRRSASFERLRALVRLPRAASAR